MSRVSAAQRARLGAFLMLSGAIFTVAVLALVGSAILEKRDEYLIRFQGSVSGLDAGATVTYNGIRVGRIEDVKVSPDSKCIVYTSQRNNIYKTTDCSRTWQNIFVDPRSEVVVTALAVDPFDTSVVYAGNSSGDVMKSTDYGVSWKTVNRLGDKVAKIIVYPEDSDIVYVATQKKGISKSLDEGVTWEDLSNSLGEYNGALNYKQLIFSPSEEHALIHASEYGLLKSTDGAASWQSLRLITPAKGVTAMAVAVDPEDSDRIFYSNGNTLLYSVDGGVNWKSKKLDTSRWASYLLIEPENTKVMYMGTLMPSGKR